MTKILARRWKKTKDGEAVCGLCFHHCIIGNNERGYCQVRAFEDGVLYTYNYGDQSAINIDPVEKKPLYHFLPGSLTFSIGAPGCDFDCNGCQNYQLSRPGSKYLGPKEPADPLELVAWGLQNGCLSFSFTYSEPTVFYEYAEDVGRRAMSQGLRSIWVTNGFFSKEVLDSLDYVSAMNIDLKGFTEKFYKDVASARLKPVKDNIKRVHQMGIWLEITTLIIPTLNDSARELENMFKKLLKV